MVSLDPDTEQDSEGIGAALDSRTEQGERQRRERPCRTHGPDFWRSTTAQPTSKVRERGDLTRAGVIKEFTGISDPYEPPAAPELVLDAGQGSVDEEAEAILDAIRSNDFIS